uniref:Uncharacterized protein n=1 Tax=Salix viminalis TaxID=40686 RepID=A0A6N2K1U6_SALVM
MAAEVKACCNFPVPHIYSNKVTRCQKLKRATDKNSNSSISFPSFYGNPRWDLSPPTPHNSSSSMMVMIMGITILLSGVHQDQRFLRCLGDDLKWGPELSVMVMVLMLCRYLLVSSTKGSSKDQIFFTASACPDGNSAL